MGLLLDTSVVLLWVVGGHDPQQIAHSKRTDSFDEQDFNGLKSLLDRWAELLTTQAIMTEALNLLGNHPRLQERLRDVARPWREARVDLHATLKDRVLPRMGFADTATIQVAAGGATVVTVDSALYIELLSRRCKAINLRHLRTQ